jgi:hypothetical protein
VQIPKETAMSGAGSIGSGSVQGTSGFSLPEEGADAPEATQAQEAAIDRSGPPPEVWQAMAQNTSASLLASDLLEASDEAGLGEFELTEAGEELIDELIEVDQETLELEDELTDLEGQLEGIDDLDALSMTELEERIAWIEEELAFLYEYEDLLWEELEDPNLDYFEEAWIEWDLWDCEFEIFDLEEELASLQGEMSDRTFDDLLGEYFDGFGGWVDSFLFAFEQDVEAKADTGQTDGQESTRKILRDLVRQREDMQQKRTTRDASSLSRAAAQNRSRGPAPTQEIRQQVIEQVRPRVEAFQAEPSLETARDVREAVLQIRGPRPAHAERLN